MSGIKGQNSIALNTQATPKNKTMNTDDNQPIDELVQEDPYEQKLDDMDDDVDDEPVIFSKDE